jgi:hypothetical protein
MTITFSSVIVQASHTQACRYAAKLCARCDQTHAQNGKNQD